MHKCLIYNSSLKFSKGIYGVLIFIAFLLQNYWLVLVSGFLMIAGIFSIKLNFFYQFHALVLRKLTKVKSEPIRKESGELNFVSGVGAICLVFGFLLLYFERFVNFAWILILTIALLMLLSYFVGICVAASMYVIFKNFLNTR